MSCAFVPFLCLALSVAIVTIQRLILPQLAPWGTLSLIRALVPLCTVPHGAAIAANFCIAIWCHCCSVAVAIFGCGHYSSPVIAPSSAPLPLPFQLPASLWSSLPLPLPACPSHSYVNCRNTKNIYKHYLIMKLFSAINNTRHCSRRGRRKRTVQGGRAARGRAGECQLT